MSSNLIRLHSFDRAREICAEHPRYPKRKLGHVTYLAQEGDDYVVRLFGKAIVYYRPDGSILFDTCGWKTVTTKDRMNQLMPSGWRLYSERGQWWLVYPGTGYNWDNAPKWAIDQSFILTPAGSGWTVQGAMAGEEVAAQKKLIKSVKKYAKDYASQLFAGKVPKPGPGDCFGCAWSDSKTGQPIMGTDHLLSHIEERYYVPSLLIIAGKANTAKLSQMARYEVQQIWENGGPSSGDSLSDHLRGQVQKTIEDYMLRELELG